jgi:putative ABC transport system substrate-binding protein
VIPTAAAGLGSDEKLPVITRRLVVASLATCLLPARSRAQATKRHLIAVLHTGAASDFAKANTEALVQGLRELGYRDADLAIEDRFGGPGSDLRVIAAELVQLRPEVIVTGGTPAAQAALQATPTIPIVTAVSGDPVRFGLVASLARPGGHLTGLSMDLIEIAGKRLQLIVSAVPAAHRVAWLTTSTDPARGPGWPDLQQAAARLHVDLMPVAARVTDEFPAAFATMVTEHADAIDVAVSPVVLVNAARVALLAAQSRLPAIYGDSTHVRAGGLMSYGPDTLEMWRHAAGYVEKIFKGANPGDLPVEQPIKFELAINLAAAKAIGLSVPQSLLDRADQVIE